MFEKIKEFLLKCGRVFRIMKKPTMAEFKLVSKVSAIGILIIGLIGFLVFLAMRLFKF
jgi:protein transport protein SEC61 subunit gamma-like protein